VADPIAEVHVRDLQSRGFLVSASVRGEVPLPVLQMLRERAELLALDVQGYVRVVTGAGRLAYEAWPEQAAVLALVDVLKTRRRGRVPDRQPTSAPARAAALGQEGADTRTACWCCRTAKCTRLPRPLRGRSGRGDTCVGSHRRRLSRRQPSRRMGGARRQAQAEVRFAQREDVAALLTDR
jgi:hypothetical protein